MAAKRVTGASEATRAMRELARLVGPAGNAACKRALEPTLAVAKQGVPEDTGTLKKSLIIKRDSQSPKTKPRYAVGPDAAAKGKDGRRPVRYAHLAEFGRAANANGTGGMLGSRFLTKAYEATKEQVVTIFGREIGPAIEKQAARIAVQKAKRAARR